MEKFIKNKLKNEVPIYTKKIWSPKSSQVKLQKKFIKKVLIILKLKKLIQKGFFLFTGQNLLIKKIYSNYECIQFRVPTY